MRIFKMKTKLRRDHAGQDIHDPALWGFVMRLARHGSVAAIPGIEVGLFYASEEVRVGRKPTSLMTDLPGMKELDELRVKGGGDAPLVPASRRPRPGHCGSGTAGGYKGSTHGSPTSPQWFSQSTRTIDSQGQFLSLRLHHLGERLDGVHRWSCVHTQLLTAH